jgi:hypothetical protein
MVSMCDAQPDDSAGQACQCSNGCLIQSQQGESFDWLLLLQKRRLINSAVTLITSFISLFHSMNMSDHVKLKASLLRR